MNEEDKKRFARYRKGYIPTLEDEEYINGNTHSNKTTKIGFIENINVNMNILVNDIIVNNSTKKSH